MVLEAYLQFVPLLIFGNIENLVLSSQVVVKGADSLKIAIVSIICVILWLIIGTAGTNMAMQYSAEIEFIGGFAIFVLGLQSMIESVRFNEDTEYN